MKQLFPSLPTEPKLADVFQRFPAAVRPLLELNEAVMRGESDLTVAERELIAAYVSSLNACQFCLDAHAVFARAHGIAPDLIAALLEDLEGAAIDDRLRPILRYVRKLTLSPAQMIEADARAVYEAGWREEALFDVVQVCAVFSLMNRIVEGAGVLPLADSGGDDPSDLPRMDSYIDFGRRIGVI
ncbi:carboxymuconolactone decarboxylase family protein [Antarctobacter jejuensis]|uniref:carboxymuconolactone decarboxylase family protein n=1 Tax=Antarctobacter jejuensis TaxID=1439938 RepID=UPI003FD1C035